MLWCSLNQHEPPHSGGLEGEPILEGGRGSWDTCVVKLGTEVVRSTCTWPLLRPPPRIQKWSLIASRGLGCSGWGFLSLSWGAHARLSPSVLSFILLIHCGTVVSAPWLSHRVHQGLLARMWLAGWHSLPAPSDLHYSTLCLPLALPSLLSWASGPCVYWGADLPGPQ